MPILKNSITAGNVALAPEAVQATFAPSSGNNLYEVGQVWIDMTTNIAYTLTSFVNGVPTWTETAPGGGGVFSNLTVSPGPTAITGEFRVNGNVNEANVIRLSENGGALGTITIQSLQGTDPNSILVHSVNGGINILTDAAEGDIAITSTGGTVTIQSSENEASNIFLQSSGGTAATMVISNSTGTVDTAIPANASIYLSSTSGGVGINAGKDFNIAAVDTSLINVIGAGETLDLRATDGNILIEANNVTGNGLIEINANMGTAADIELNAVSSGGGITFNSDTGGFVVVTSGLFDITATGGFDLDITGAINFDASSASSFVVTGAAQDLTLQSVGGSVNVLASEAVADAIVISATGASAGIQIAPAATVASIAIGNITPTVSRTTIIAGGSTLNTAHTDLVSIADGGVSTSASAEKEVTIATGATAVGITLVSIATGDISAAGNTTLNLATGNVPAGTTQLINIGTGTGGGTKSVDIGGAFDFLTAVNVFGTVDINTSASTATTTIGNTTNAGRVNIDSIAASHFTVTGATADLTLSSSGGSVNMLASEAAGDAIVVNASSGGFQVASVLTSSVTVAGAAADLNLNATGGSVNITATEAISDAVVVTASGAAGGIKINASDALGTILLTTGAGAGVGGLISVANNTVVGTAGDSPTVSVTNNARVGKITFAGYLTAASATLVVTLTNSFIAANSAIIATVTNTQVAQTATLAVTGIVTSASTAVITLTNNGAQALDGNIVLTFWVLS